MFGYGYGNFIICAVIVTLVVWVIADEITIWKSFKERDKLKVENYELKESYMLHRTK